jgi:DNA replication protein DnaC
MGLLKLADKYSLERLKAVCQKALTYKPYPSYKSVKNILVTGSTRSGKSYLACALGMEACKHYYTTKCIRLLLELLAELTVARGEGKFKETIKQYQKYTLLILDEWLLVNLTETEARDLLEIILDRIVHDSYPIEIQYINKEHDKSMREIYGVQ